MLKFDRAEAEAARESMMTRPEFLRTLLTETDLDFLIGEALPDFSDKTKLRSLAREDEAFRDQLLCHDAVFSRLAHEPSIFLLVSPVLYFEVLLRQVVKQLESSSHTVERTAGHTIPVFDTDEVAGVLSQEWVMAYLAHMLTTFTKIESFSIAVRVRDGIWRRVRYNDMDIGCLSRFCDGVDQEHKFEYYKRIADVCLFLLGIFPEYIQFPPGPGKQPLLRLMPWGAEEYEAEGRRFYKLAGEHVSARDLELTAVFETLHGNFNAARKSLNLISYSYLPHRKHDYFGLEPM